MRLTFILEYPLRAHIILKQHTQDQVQSLHGVDAEHYELHDNMEQPALFLAHSGRRAK